MSIPSSRFWAEVVDVCPADLDLARKKQKSTADDAGKERLAGKATALTAWDGRVEARSIGTAELLPNSKPAAKPQSFTVGHILAIHLTWLQPQKVTWSYPQEAQRPIRMASVFATSSAISVGKPPLTAPPRRVAPVLTASLTGSGPAAPVPAAEHLAALPSPAAVLNQPAEQQAHGGAAPIGHSQGQPGKSSSLTGLAAAAPNHDADILPAFLRPAEQSKKPGSAAEAGTTVLSLLDRARKKRNRGKGKQEASPGPAKKPSWDSLLQTD